MIDWTRYGTTTPSKYRFTLSYILHSENGVLELKHAPLEWADMDLLLKRDPVTHGVYISAVVSSLTFVKEGKQLLQDLYASKNVFSQCDLFIYYLDHTKREYVSMPTSYKLDFNTYQVVNVSKSTNGVRINCLETDMVSKFQQRKDTEVNLNNLTGLSGFSITPYTALKKNVNIGAISQYNAANYANSDVNNYLLKSSEIGADTTEYIYTPMTFSYSDFFESVNVFYAVRTGHNGASAFLTQMTEERDLNIKGSYTFTINELSGLNNTLGIYMVVLDVSNNVLITRTLATYAKGASGEKTLTINEDITSVADSYVTLVAVSFVEAGGNDQISVSFGASNLQVTQALSSSPAITAESMPVYEAMERCLQLVCDTQFPFYSEFFGRTDTPYNIAGDFYASENQLRFANLMPGICLRQMPMANQSFPVKFSDLFKAIRSIWCVGCGFETVGGLLKFRIEELSHFYQDDLALDLTINNRINEIEIETEQYAEGMFAKIKSGYAKFTYESVMGRGEYNTTNQRTTVVPNDNQFDNSVPFRADTKGALDLILKNIHTSGTEDVQGDEDIFIIKTQRGAVQHWDAETDENITIEENTSLFQDGSLNLYMTPTRNLIRNGQIINAGLSFMPGTKLAYQTSDKNSKLKTTGEGYTVTENQDIVVYETGTVAHLPAPLWHPELLHLEIPFYEEDFVALNAKPLGYVKLSETYSGWIKDIKWKFAKNRATITLIRRIQS